MDTARSLVRIAPSAEESAPEAQVSQACTLACPKAILAAGTATTPGRTIGAGKARVSMKFRGAQEPILSPITLPAALSVVNHWVN
jgi:hypothetical protein